VLDRRIQLRHWLARYWLEMVAGFAVLLCAALYFLLPPDVSSAWRDAIGVVAFFPPALLLTLLVRSALEVLLLLLLVAVFKLVTFGQFQTEWRNPNVKFPWYGIARNKEGRLVASEVVVFSVALVALVALGAVGWAVYAG